MAAALSACRVATCLALLAAERRGAAGGIGGRPVELPVRASRTTPAAALQGLQQSLALGCLGDATGRACIRAVHGGRFEPLP
nr:hypothetical protein [Variovorax boronicumulans]